MSQISCGTYSIGLKFVIEINSLRIPWRQAACSSDQFGALRPFLLPLTTLKGFNIHRLEITFLNMDFLTSQRSVYYPIFGFIIIILTLICLYLSWFFALMFDKFPSWSIGSRLSNSKKNELKPLTSHKLDCLFVSEQYFR